MNKLYELREKIIAFYNKYEVFVLPVIKLICAFAVFHCVNSALGYFSRIDNIAIELIASLLCSFLPTGFILVFAGLFSLLHMYSLSLIVLAIGVIVYLILYLMFFRFAPKASLAVALTPVLMAMKIPYILPVVLGLVAGPGSAVAVFCGVIAYYFVKVVNSSAEAISKLSLSEATDQLKIIVDGLAANKGMIIVGVAFAATVVVTYLIRRLPMNKNWELAIGAGALADMLILLIGGAIMKTGLSAVNIILVSILAVGVGFVVKFFGYCVDFSRVENVQFEDDDYYYYVKAVPKINLGIANKSRKSSKKKKSSYAPQGQLDDIYDDGIDEENYDENYEYSEDGEYYEDGTYYEDGVAQDGYESEEGYDENYDGNYDENYDGVE